MKKAKFYSQIVACLAILLAGNAAHAAISLTFGSGSQNLGHLENFSAGGVDFTLSGWSNVWGNRNDEFKSRDLIRYGTGLGIKTDGAGSPQHAVGDYNADEFILLEASEYINIKHIGNSWWEHDSDASVLAWDPDMNPILHPSSVHDTFERDDMPLLNSDTGDLTPSTSGLTNAGWVQVDPYTTADIGYGKDIHNNLLSKYWLIGNVNRHLTSGISTHNDFFKLNLVKFETCAHRPNDPRCNPGTTTGGDTGGVPVPGTALLLGLGLLIMRARARR